MPVLGCAHLCSSHGVKRILCYLSGTADLGTKIHKCALSAFSDADWAGCPNDRRSTGGFAMFLGSNLISWSAHNQWQFLDWVQRPNRSPSPMPPAEVIWVQSVLKELIIPQLFYRATTSVRLICLPILCFTQGLIWHSVYSNWWSAGSALTKPISATRPHDFCHNLTLRRLCLKRCVSR